MAKALIAATSGDLTLWVWGAGGENPNAQITTGDEKPDPKKAQPLQELLKMVDLEEWDTKPWEAAKEASKKNEAPNNAHSLRMGGFHIE